ncbi:acyl transferase domain-containing protein [Staphylotrichum tortipilum]|uniref:Acyl transferase domain-containing protein n=1 Tax=Staphylotrichum tortipilum TaxID=2831512 RepID=A0AAN6MJM2_9PEZI|nr:acyl transferase domain-containing protein [Staphylotrichum longicolle]
MTAMMALPNDEPPQTAEDGEPKHTSALLRASEEGSARLCAIFGGQGSNNLTALADIIDLTTRHGPALQTLLTHSSRTVFSLSSTPHTSNFHEDHPFDLELWLSDPSLAPPPSHLALSPLSFPLNTLLSLLQYTITCTLLNLHPGELRPHLRAVTGHSQGLFAALAVAQGSSWQTFYQACDAALRLSFHVGLEAHCVSLASTIAASAQAGDEGTPSPMLNVTGLSREQITHLLETVNAPLPEDRKVHLALQNSRNKFILAGPPQSLRSVCARIKAIAAPAGMDQTRVLARDRKPVVEAQFLPISAAYHTPYLAGVEERVKLRMGEVGGLELGVPLLHTAIGEDLRKLGDLLGAVVRAVTVDVVDWPGVVRGLVDAAEGGVTHVLDFGPGMIGGLVRELTEGMGVRVVQVSDRVGARGVSGREEVVGAEVEVVKGVNWAEEFGLRLVEGEDGVLAIENKMTRVFGAPPVMVAGMTPTTVPWEFVAGVMAAGYHVELAGGGYWEKKGFEEALRGLARAVPAGRGITCNLLYANPKTIAWQVSLLRRLAGEGIPIDGITVGAGIPSPEVVKEYIESIPGLRHISFKPGSLSAIHQVIDIAEGHPHFPIGLQWTGGRAGGHHSWEDFHRPILATYGPIRRCPNIVLIAGSGFGGASDTLPFFTGEWAHKFGRPTMPFDGVLLGSRMMVAKDAHTSRQAKELIIRASGVDNNDWHGSFDKPTGGVITVESEMGQPIHVLATRGMVFWKELDQRVFSMRDKSKRLEYLRLHKDEIAHRLNRDYFRPWFAVDESGNNVDLVDMTYSEVLCRLCELMYVHHQSRWIDESYRTLVHAFVRLAEGRFGRRVNLDPGEHRPEVMVQLFEQTLQDDAEDVLYPIDVSLLLALFRRRGQKPVPFIPQLDEHFQTWFKKDSLWQSEDVDAVINQDADRVCVIQGPVAVSYSTTCDDSAKDILDNISRTHIQLLQHAGVVPQTPQPRGPVTSSRGPLTGVKVMSDGLTVQYELCKKYDTKDTETLLEHVIEAAGSWARPCLTNGWIFRGRVRVRNPIQAAFCPQAGDLVEVRPHIAGSATGEISLITGGTPLSKARRTLDISLADPGCVAVTLAPLAPAHTKQARVRFQLELRLGSDGIKMFEYPSSHVAAVKALYSQLWIRDARSASLPQFAGLSSEFRGDEMVLSEHKINEFLDVVNRGSAEELRGWNPRGSVPIDYCVVVAWSALIKPLMIPALDCNLLQLLHRSIRFRYVPSAKPLHLGDAIKTYSRITALTIKPTGTLVQVSADIRRHGERVVSIDTEFFIRGAPSSGLEKQEFTSVDEPELIVDVSSPILNALLITRKWLIFEDHSPDLIGKKLSFKLTSHTMFSPSGDIALLQVSGLVTLANPGSGRPIRLGRVYFEEESCAGNPVIDFLQRHGAPSTARQQLAQPGWSGPSSTITVQAPTNSAAYAAVSLDGNPIHICPVFARYAGLDGTVVHGMHTSAIVRRAVEWMLGDAERTRFRGWQASFEAMVRPGDRLRVEMQHVAVDSGRMVLSVLAVNEETGERVLEGEAEVEQPRTGYVFCGQGSQEKGMGMALYAASPEVRALWDRAETYLRENYGFSILNIVRDNPTSLTVHFSGKRGRHIRDKYLSMTRRVALPGGGSRDEPILAGLTPRSRSYTFSYPKGLLMSTQFSQPALALMDIAEFAHLQARGVVQAGARFAGHSLGEYAALGACTSFMPFESLLSLIYYRGLKMQNALPRDPDGRTDYTMVAADPSRINPEFTETHFQSLVDLIADETGLLLEVVNYNICSQQYVCAGHIEDYREYLGRSVRSEDVKVEELVGRWVPNVVGEVFGVDVEFVERVVGVTGSVVLMGVLEGMKGKGKGMGI